MQGLLLLCLHLLLQEREGAISVLWMHPTTVVSSSGGRAVHCPNALLALPCCLETEVPVPLLIECRATLWSVHCQANPMSCSFRRWWSLAQTWIPHKNLMSSSMKFQSLSRCNNTNNGWRAWGQSENVVGWRWDCFPAVQSASNLSLALDSTYVHVPSGESLQGYLKQTECCSGEVVSIPTTHSSMGCYSNLVTLWRPSTSGFITVQPSVQELTIHHWQQKCLWAGVQDSLSIPLLPPYPMCSFYSKLVVMGRDHPKHPDPECLFSFINLSSHSCSPDPHKSVGHQQMYSYVRCWKRAVDCHLLVLSPLMVIVPKNSAAFCL